MRYSLDTYDFGVLIDDEPWYQDAHFYTRRDDFGSEDEYLDAVQESVSHEVHDFEVELCISAEAYVDEFVRDTYEEWQDSVFYDDIDEVEPAPVLSEVVENAVYGWIENIRSEYHPQVWSGTRDMMVREITPVLAPIIEVMVREQEEHIKSKDTPVGEFVLELFNTNRYLEIGDMPKICKGGLCDKPVDVDATKTMNPYNVVPVWSGNGGVLFRCNPCRKEDNLVPVGQQIRGLR